MNILILEIINIIEKNNVDALYICDYGKYNQPGANNITI